jgi:deoxyribonuclease V
MESHPIMNGDEIIGYALKPCKRCKSIYISPGSYISPETALLLTKKCLKGHRLPEPVRIAHTLATKARKKLL